MQESSRKRLASSPNSAFITSPDQPLPKGQHMSTTQLTPAQHAILAYALERTNGKIDWFPDNIKGGARKKVLDGLFNRALITTDGFLYPNAELERRGILNKKGFPESYDAKRLLSFLASVKSGRDTLEVPVYSHLFYDVIKDEIQSIDRPDILIVEGINVLQVTTGKKTRRRVFVSDFFDFSIYVDASERDLREWYLERFKKLQQTAFLDPNSYFHKYASYPEKKLLKFANKVWDEINLLNLEQNILPTRFRADLILEKGECHFVRGVRIRKI